MKTSTKPASRDGAAPGGPVAKRSLFARYGMLVCCVAMTLPIAGYLLSGGSFGGLLDDLALVVPVLACVGMHFCAASPPRPVSARWTRRKRHAGVLHPRPGGSPATRHRIGPT